MAAKGKVGQFNRFIKYNHRAIESLEDLANFGMYNPKQIISLFNSVVNNIIGMGKAYCKISDFEIGSIILTIDRLVETGFHAVQGAAVAVKTGASTSDAIYTTIKENLLKKVCNVSDEFSAQGFRAKSIDETQTLHELVRYLHQGVIQALLDVPLGGANLSRYKRSEITYIDGVTLNIIDIGGAFKPKDACGKIESYGITDSYDRVESNDGIEPYDEIESDDEIESIPLRAIIDFYTDPRSEKKEGDETYEGIAAREFLNVFTDLGEHKAEIRARVIADGSGSITFKYRDSIGYSCSGERAELFKRIAQRLGYSVTKDKRRVEGYFSSDNHGEAYKLLTETVRLFASVKDVDTLTEYKKK